MTDPVKCDQPLASQLYLGWTDMKWTFVGQIKLYQVHILYHILLCTIYYILLYTRLPGQRSVQWLTTPSQSTFQVKQTVRIETFEYLNSILMAFRVQINGLVTKEN